MKGCTAKQKLVPKDITNGRNVRLRGRIDGMHQKYIEAVSMEDGDGGRNCEKGLKGVASE